MKIAIVCIYPQETVARFLLSGYVLKGYLEKYSEIEGLQVDVLNFGERSKAELICEKLRSGGYDMAAYSCYIWNIEKILETVKELRKEGLPVVHVFGGPEISAKRIHTFPADSGADLYIIGEGERKLLNLVACLRDKEKGCDGELPAGVAVLRGEELIYTEEGEEDTVQNLDEIPSVYLDHVIEDRLYERQQVFLETQRGCRFKCKYCVYHKFVSGIKYYSEGRVIKELGHLIGEKHITALRFTDSIFTSDLERGKNIVRYLLELKKKKDVKLPWIYWEFDYNYVDEEFAELTAKLKNRGDILNTDELEPLDRPQLYSDMLKDYVVINSIGIESFDENALKGVGRRRVDIGRFDKFMKMMDSNNLVLKMDLIWGLPFETVETFFSGLELIVPYLKGADHVLNIHRLQILPGSELEELTDEYKIEYSREAPHTVYSNNTITREDLNYTGKLNSVLSRIVNSPLRSLFFASWESSGKGLKAFLDDVFGKISSRAETAGIPLVKEDMIYDSYWNDDIYRDIPSNFLKELLGEYS